MVEKSEDDMTNTYSNCRQSSRIFDEQAEDLNYEKRKTDGLLQQLLPVEIIAQLKAGEQPSPK